MTWTRRHGWRHKREKSDLRNHQAIVQPRLYDSLMVTQITLKTEGPHGLPSGRQTEVDPLYRGLIILTVYDCGHASHPRELMSRARTQRLETGCSGVATSGVATQGLRIKPVSETFCGRASPAGIEPVGFRVKNDLRNHCAIVQPRLYDSAMVTQIILNTEPHGFDSCRGRSTAKSFGNGLDA